MKVFYTLCYNKIATLICVEYPQTSLRVCIAKITVCFTRIKSRVLQDSLVLAQGFHVMAIWLLYMCFFIVMYTSYPRVLFSRTDIYKFNHTSSLARGISTHNQMPAKELYAHRYRQELYIISAFDPFQLNVFIRPIYLFQFFTCWT